MMGKCVPRVTPRDGSRFRQAANPIWIQQESVDLDLQGEWCLANAHIICVMEGKGGKGFGNIFLLPHLFGPVKVLVS